MEKTICPSCFREYEGAKCPHCNGAHNHEHQLPVGTLLRDRYKIGKVLGQGGFGITYIAWDTLMHRTVAVKEFYPSGTVFRRSQRSLELECVSKELVPHYEYSKERFLREAGALVKFQSIPQVVDILDFARENGTAYIIMEYVKGVDLRKYILRKGRCLTVTETFRILRPVMEALAQVHRGGIVHRDISPDNIILDPMGGAKLLDFGAVRSVMAPDVEKDLDKSTEAIVKHGFAPIEQYNTRGGLGPWTDEYAMCATIWYCLTGKVPDDASIRMSEETDPDWCTIPDLPEHQQKALTKGFSRRAKDRFRSMDELLAALFPEPPVPEPPVPEPPDPDPAPGPKPDEREEGGQPPKPGHKVRGKTVRIIGAAAAVFLVIFAAVFVSLRSLMKPHKVLPAEPQPSLSQWPGSGKQPLSLEEQDYLRAERLLTEGRFQEAIDIFTALGDYKDSPDRVKECNYRWAEADLEAGDLSMAAIRFGKLSGYLDAREQSLGVWDQIAVRDTVTAGEYHTLSIRGDRTVAAAGYNQHGQCDVRGWSQIIAVSTSFDHSVGLRADGTIVAAGLNKDGQCNVSDWSNIVAVSAGWYHTVGLLPDGTVVAVGSNEHSQCDVSQWTDIIAISAGDFHTIGLRADGTVVAAGINGFGECDVSEWTDVVAVHAGLSTTIGVRADGSVLISGWMYSPEILDWTNIADVRSSASLIIGLDNDGTVRAVTGSSISQSELAGWKDIVEISTGQHHVVGLRSDGTLAIIGEEGHGISTVTGWKGIPLPGSGQRTKDAQPDPLKDASYAQAEELLAQGKLGEAAIAFGKLSGYRNARERSFEIWDQIAVRETVVASNYHTVGLKDIGTVVTAGQNDHGQCNVSEWTNIIAVSSTFRNTVGLKSDGTVVIAGENDYGQCDISGWTDIVAVSSGVKHTVGLKSDGTVTAVGRNGNGQCDVNEWSDIVAISTGRLHTVGLKADGTVVAVGDNDYGQCEVSQWTDIVAISAGNLYTVGLKADGTVVTVGDNEYSQRELPSSSWNDIAATSACFHTVGLKHDGTVIAVGSNGDGQCKVTGWTDIIAVSAGCWHTIGLKADGTVVAVGDNDYEQCKVSGWKGIMIPKERAPFR